MKAVLFEIKGKKYSCKPTFEVIEAIESSTGKGTLQLVREIINADYKMSELVKIVSCIVGAQSKELSMDKIADEVMGNVKTFSVPVVTYLVECNQGAVELETDVTDGGTEGNV